MKIFFKYAFISVIILLNLNCFSRSAGGKQEYGSIVTFKKGDKIEFADLNVEYTGDRDVKSNFSNGNSFTFHYKDFTVSEPGNPDNKKTVSWTSGTGDIGPVEFELNNKKFSLELAHSEKLNKWLKEDEMIINKN